MKRLIIFGIVMALLLIIAATLATSISGEVIKSTTKETILFGDDFEGYDVGTFPSSGGWELWFNGAGNEYQIIMDNVSASPTKSLQLLGLDGWAAFAAKRFTTNALKIGFQVNVRVNETRGGVHDNARVSFTRWISPCISREYAPVVFEDDGTIGSNGRILQSYIPGKWYKVTFILDRPSDTYCVWIDDVLCGENLNLTTTSLPETEHPSYEIEAFSVSQCYNHIMVYFDDVKVFTVPTLRIESIARTPMAPNYDEDVVVSATFTGDVEVDQAFLSYTYDLTWYNVSMSKADSMSNATIPSQPYGTLVQYKIYANDTNGNWVVSSIYSYSVSDLIPPEIVEVKWTPEEPTQNDTVKVAANISEPVDASGVSKILFSFKDCFGQWWNTTMTYNDASDLWNVIISQQPHNTTVQFYIIAYDNAGNTAVGEYYFYTILPEFSFSAVLLLALASITLTIMITKKARLPNKSCL